MTKDFVILLDARSFALSFSSQVLAYFCPRRHNDPVRERTTLSTIDPPDGGRRLDQMQSGQNRYVAWATDRYGEGAVKFRVELVWKDDEQTAASIYLTSDGRVILQGRAVSQTERATLSLPPEGDMISVDRNLVQAIKDML